MPTAWSSCSLCPDPQVALLHANPSGPNSSPRFPLQVDRNSPLHIPCLSTPGLAQAHPHVHAPAHAQMHGPGCRLELHVGDEWDRSGLALVLNSFPEIEVSRLVTCEHSSRGVSGRGSVCGSTFGGKQSCAQNHVGVTSGDWCQGLIV